MRLNWNNIGRGLTDVANAVKEKRLKDDLNAVNEAKLEEIDVTQGIDPNAAGAPEGGNPDVYAPTEIAAGAPQANGISKRYRMFDVESDKPLTQEEIDDLRMARMADVYTKHGQNDRAFAIKEHLTKTQRQRKQDARADEEFAWKQEDRAAAKGLAFGASFSVAELDQPYGANYAEIYKRDCGLLTSELEFKMDVVSTASEVVPAFEYRMKATPQRVPEHPIITKM